ncbi:flagellin FlaB [Methanococcus maripaludis]|uniref:Flagellin n=1 Tax=Methanococcus maripaludis TaxID=39152 RepID=A0A7J9P7I8_METMI|nr:flagellin [Methanococcus maripaludis]MBA2857359.1 flagellin FlaB [Methanococcus maripaludis]
MKITEFMKSKKGASGIGTLIVFIAMVLVAAVAASVLINTSGFLQQKAATTGKESTEQVASGLQIIQVMGKVNNAADNIEYITLIVTPNAGSSSIDLSQATLMLTDGNKKVVKKYDLDNHDAFDFSKGSLFTGDSWGLISSEATEFGIKEIQDADESCDASTPVINKGDVVAITIKNPAAGGLTLDQRTPVSGTFEPEFGAPGVISFTTPATYLADGVVELQ